MKYIVYKTTNLINNKFYIGVHDTNNKPNYLGSGTHLKRAIKKYGKQNFKRETLFEFDNIKDAYEMEASIVDQDFLDTFSNAYNIKLGGIGSSGTIGMKHKNKSKLKMSNSRKKYYKIHDAYFKDKVFSEEHKNNISVAKQGSIPWNKDKKNIYSEETINKMRKAKQGITPKIVECPICGKQGGINIMHRHHFDNCKLKDNYEN